MGSAFQDVNVEFLDQANSNLETARAKVDVLNLRLQSEIRERKFAENRAFSARYERDINVSV